MKKIQILIIVFLISLSICALARMQVKAQISGQFVFNTISSPQTSGVPFSITITAEAMGSPVTSYAGTPTLSVSTGTISPTVISGFSNGVWTGQVNVTGPGLIVTITAIDGAASGTSNSFKVNPGVLNHFTLSTPGSVTAGSSFGSVTVTAYDGNGNLKTDFTGSIYFTSSDSSATLPYISSSRYTFVSGDNGVHTFSGFILKTAPSQTITATDGSISTASSSIIVNDAGVSKFVFAAIGTQTAGVAFNVGITAQDAFGNTVTSYAGNPSLTYSAGTINPTSSGAFVSGTKTVSVTVTSAGTGVTITATDASVISTSSGFTVNIGMASKLVYTAGTTQTLTAGVVSPTAIVVQRQDQYGNPVSIGTSAITVTLSTTSSGGIFFNSGGTTITSINIAAGSSSSAGFYYKDTVTASPTLTVAYSGLTSATTQFTINDAGVSKFVFAAIGTQTAGVAFNVGITAQDAFGNTVTSYAGNPSLTYSAGTINPTSSGAFVSGTKTVSVTVTSAGTGVTITATEGTTMGTSGTFNVNTGAATHLAVSSGTSQVAGTPFSITVTAKDANGNTATSYTGTVHFSSSDSGVSVSLPSNYAFVPGDLGNHTFTNGVTLMTVGTQSVTVTDTAAGSITGSQPGIKVTISSGIHFVVTGFSVPATAGSVSSVTVTVKDQYGNLFNGYSGIVKITSSDNKAVLPPNAGLTNGIGSFAVTLKTIGSQSITAIDTVNSAIIGSQSNITVNPAVATNVVISPVNIVVTVGSTTIYSATASDAYGNSWNVTSSITSWSINSGAGGSWSNNVYTSAYPGLWTITGTYASKTYNTSLTVNAGHIDHFAFNTVDSQIVGSSFTITITAVDASGNTVTSYTGSPTLTYSAGSISPTVMAAFVSGVGTTSVTANAASSSATITATDGVYSGTSNSFKVTSAATSPPGSSSQPTPTSSTSPNPTSTPSPTQIPNSVILTTLTESGKNATLIFQGDITSSSISSITINTDGSNTTTTISLAVVAQSNTNGFDNITIPISAVPYGTIPTVYVNNGVAQNQGYTHDSKNYYVWFKTGYSTYELSIAFETKTAPSDFPLWAVIVIAGIVIASVLFVLLQKNLKNIRFKLPAFPKFTQ